MILYFHRNIITLEIFYVGIGVNKKRAYSKRNRNKYWNNYVNKHEGFTVEIKHSGLSKEEVCKKEIFYISKFGKKINGGQLVNLADGGETNAGCKKSAEQIKQVSERAIRRGTSHMMTKEAREKAAKSISIALKGKMVGNKNPNYGNRWTAEMKESLSRKKKEYYLQIPKKIKKIKPKIDPIIARQNMYNAMKLACGKKVINTKTGEIYLTIVDAANSISMKKDTLRQKLNGKNPNNTSLKYLLNSGCSI